MSREKDVAEKMIITVRIIKSFEFRTFKNIILNSISNELTVGDLKSLVKNKIKELKGYNPDKYDTLKIYFKTHGSKTSNLIINVNDGDDFLKDDVTLQDAGVENETEISFFNAQEYQKFKENPEIKW